MLAAAALKLAESRGNSGRAGGPVSIRGQIERVWIAGILGLIGLGLVILAEGRVILHGVQRDTAGRSILPNLQSGILDGERCGAGNGYGFTDGEMFTID